MNRFNVSASVQLWSKNMDTPFHEGRKRAHHATSALVSAVTRMWWWNLATVVDRSINRRRNRHPAGTTLAANDSLPMKDSSSRFEALRRLSQDCTSSRISASFSCGRESVRASESRRIPRNVIWVDGPSSLSKATGTPKCSQTDRVTRTEAAHCRSRPAAPEMRKSPR